MKILVIGGMHGNEPLGIELVKLFQSDPCKSVDVVLANEQAVSQNCRFVENDLNRSFPGSTESNDYETNRSAELLEITKGYDVVLDFHNTHCPDNDCGFVGQAAPQQIYDISSWLGLNRVIVADYDCINKYAPNCLSVEISLSSQKMSVKKWYKKISELSQFDKLQKARDIEKYRFVYRITLEDKKKFDLPKKSLRAFKPLDQKLAEQMQVKSLAYPIFIGDRFTPYNYGGLLNRLS